MQRLRTRRIAWLITLFMLVLAVIFGAGRSLHNKAERVEMYLYQDHGIQQNLQEISENSENLVSVAARYVEPDNVLLLEVERTSAKLWESYGAADQRAAVDQVIIAAKDLDNLLNTQSVSEADKTYKSKLMANIDSGYALLGESKYNQEVRAFNREIKRFPARILAPLTGIRPMEEF